MTETEELLASLISMTEKQIAAAKAYLENPNADYVVLSGPYNDGAYKIISGTISTRHEYNFAGMGATANGFPKYLAENIVASFKGKVETRIMRKDEYVLEYLVRTEEQLATLKSKTA